MGIMLVIGGLFLVILGGSTSYLVIRGNQTGDQISSLSGVAGNGEDGASKAKSAAMQLETLSLRKPSNRGLDTIERRLTCAQWNIPPAAFYGSQAAISLAVFVVLSFKFHFIIQLIGLFVGPLVMNSALEYALNRRQKLLDADYPVFLNSVVSMLKTGMNPLGAIEASVENLNPDSLIREEVELLMERLRVGVSEDQSIGAFAEDVPHPEVELFIQALLFSRRLGGTLSHTLERLARITRKRQYFKQSANAAVGLQRGSIYMILLIMCLLEIYLYVAFPQSITESIADPAGWIIWQVCICIILAGVVWMTKVTKIKV